MESFMKFRANDGTEFANVADAIEHEKLCEMVAEIMSTLPALPKDDGCRFANGHGYIQHEAGSFERARVSLLKAAQLVCNHKWIEQSIADPSIHASWAGRIIDESSRPLARAWHRFMCTDSQLREWGQPYYASHPEDAEQVRLN